MISNRNSHKRDRLSLWRDSIFRNWKLPNLYALAKYTDFSQTYLTSCVREKAKFATNIIRTNVNSSRAGHTPADGRVIFSASFTNDDLAVSLHSANDGKSPGLFSTYFPVLCKRVNERTSERASGRAVSACCNLRNKPHRWRCHRTHTTGYRRRQATCTLRARVGKGKRVVARVTPRRRGVPFSPITWNITRLKHSLLVSAHTSLFRVLFLFPRLSSPCPFSSTAVLLLSPILATHKRSAVLSALLHRHDSPCFLSITLFPATSNHAVGPRIAHTHTRTYKGRHCRKAAPSRREKAETELDNFLTDNPSSFSMKSISDKYMGRGWQIAFIDFSQWEMWFFHSFFYRTIVTIVKSFLFYLAFLLADGERELSGWISCERAQRFFLERSSR